MNPQHPSLISLDFWQCRDSTRLGPAGLCPQHTGGCKKKAPAYIAFLYIFIYFCICLCVFAYFLYVFVYIFSFFHIKLIVNKRGAPEAPPPITLSILYEKNPGNVYKNMQKMCKDI